MKNGGVDKYCDLMREAKDRTYAVNRILNEKANLGFMRIHVEVVYLQFRKILELVAFGSLVANFELYSTSRESYARDWHATRIVDAIKKLNPDFYPEPVSQTPVTGEKYSTRFEKLELPYLTLDDFIELYDKCGGVLHSENPYGDFYRYDVLFKEAKTWGAKIRNLLNAHQVRLVGDEGFYLIQMGASGKKPSYTYFEPLPDV